MSSAAFPSASDRKFAVFFRRQREGKTFRDFTNEIGVTPSTVYRLENMEQSVTLRTLDKILGNLKASWKDVFQDGPEKVVRSKKLSKNWFGKRLKLYSQGGGQ